IGGGIGAGGEARWVTVYASVADVEATLARAESLGATRVYGPNPADNHTKRTHAPGGGRSGTPPATCSASTTTGRIDRRVLLPQPLAVAGPAGGRPPGPAGGPPPAPGGGRGPRRGRGTPGVR